MDSFIQADDAGGMRPHLGMNQVRLVVRADDAEKALGILGPVRVVPVGEDRST